MMPRWVKVSQLRLGDIFVRQDRNVGLIEQIQQNPLLWGKYGPHYGESPKQLPKEYIESSSAMAEDKYQYLYLMRMVREASKKNFPEALDDVEKLKGAEESLKDFSKYPLSGGLFSALPGALEVGADADASIRQARVVLALYLYKSEIGSYPDSLDKLVPKYLPEMQIDPFDGKPIRYKREGKGYVLYSIYRNRKDDSGVWTNNRETGDWVWKMEK